MKIQNLIYVAALGLFACAPTASSGGEDSFKLAGSEWGLASGAEQPYIQFGGDGKATGNGGCNRFSGTYDQSGQALSFGPIMSTKMACMEMQNETAFFNTLDRTRSFEGDHLKITLKSENGEALLTLNRRDWD